MSSGSRNENRGYGDRLVSDIASDRVCLAENVTSRPVSGLLRLSSVMTLRLLLISALAIVIGARSSAQAPPSWTDAVRAGQYEKAAALLHPIVMVAEYNLTSQDPAPARQLTLMYARGLGVRQDGVGACALAQLAGIVTRSSAPKYARDPRGYDAALEEADRFINEHCSPLTEAGRRDATAAIGCYALAMPEDYVTLGNKLIRIGRQSIGVVDAPEQHTIGPLNCPLYIAAVRPTTVLPPPDAVPGTRERHVVELLFWGAQTVAAPRFSLRWHAYELCGDRMQVAAVADVRSAVPWPESPVPPNLDSLVAVAMDRNGRVRWQVSGEEPKEGTFITEPACH